MWHFCSNALVLVTYSVMLIGCSLLKARPEPATSFLLHGNELVEQRERAPLHGLWFKDRDAYYAEKQVRTKVAVAPVNTSFAEAKINEKTSSEGSRKRRTDEVREIGRYMQEKFVAALNELPGKPITVVAEPDDDTFVLELAIVDVEATNPVVNTAATAAGVFVPGGGLIKEFGTGSIAMEGRIRDGINGDELVEFKDREADKESLFTVKDFQKYAHVRAAIDDWARQYAELSSTQYEHKVADSLPLTLNPF